MSQIRRCLNRRVNSMFATNISNFNANNTDEDDDDDDDDDDDGSENDQKDDTNNRIASTLAFIGQTEIVSIKHDHITLNRIYSMVEQERNDRFHDNFHTRSFSILPFSIF